MSKIKKVPAKEILKDLKLLVEEIKTKKFTGVLAYSNSSKKKGWVYSVEGYAEDRLALVDAAVISMKNEPNKESRDWFFTQLYERFKHLRPIEINKAIV